MRVFILLNGFRHCLDVNLEETVAFMKQALRKKFDLDTVQNEDAENDMLLSLSYAGGVLEDEWIFSDIGIPSGVTLRCELIENVKSYLNIYCVYNDHTVKFTEPFTVWETSVGDLKTLITDKTGLHVSVFRLVTQDGKEMFDCKLLKDYSIGEGDTIRMETWNGWGDFLKAATKGQLTPTLKHMISLGEDPLVAKYQQRVGLFIAAHFGYQQLAALLLKSGARSDEPIGEHPVREWCNKQVHIDHHKTPIHEAAQHGHLLCLRLFIHHNYTCILIKDGAGLTPCNIARRFKHTECFKLLIAEQFRSRTMDGLTITLYARVKKWCERARVRALVFHKHNPSPLLLAMEKRDYRRAVVGQKVQVDGFGRNTQTGASKMELSLVTNAAARAAKALAVTGASEENRTSEKSTLNGKQHWLELTNGEIGESSNSHKELRDTSEVIGTRSLRDSEETKQRTRASNYSLPAVQEARYHREKSKHSAAGLTQQTNKRAKNKADRAPFNAYRWKEPSFEDRQMESVEIIADKEQKIMSENRLSMPQINGLGNPSNVMYSSLGKDVNERDDSQTKTTGERETFFVTERVVNAQENPPEMQAWAVKTADNKDNKIIPKISTEKMPPILNSLSSPDDLELPHVRKWKRRDLADKAKSEGDASHKPSLSSTNGHVRKLHQRAVSEDPSMQTSALYRHVTGLDRRESARASLDVAMTFNKKSWLQQVQLAVALNTNTFKRQILSPRNTSQNSV